MSELEKNIREIIVLSDLIEKRDFSVFFIKHFTIKVKEFQNVSSHIDLEILQRLQLKLLERLRLNLKKASNSDDKCVVMQCIIEVLKITPIHSLSEFFAIYTSIFFQIFKDANLPYQPSEELKKCALDCCTYLMVNSKQNVLDKVYSEEFGAKFSLGISISVMIVKEEKSIKLRVAALDFLLAASHFETEMNYTKEILIKIGDLFMLYLPGIVAPLLEVVLRNETQHHLITAKALSCLGHVLCLVMRDSTECENLSDSEILKQWLVSQKETQSKVIDVHAALKEKKRTKLWLEAVAITLLPLINKLSDLRKHSHPKCRLELTQVMIKLLKNCMKNLKNCLSIIIEVLVGSVMDEDVEVQKVAKKALSEFESGCNEKKVQLFLPVIEENLYSVINKLPRIAQSGNEQLLLSSLKSFSGYLRILGRLNRLQHLITLSSTLEKLISVIKIIFMLETYPEISRQNFSIWDIETDPQFWCKPWKRFRYFADQSVKAQLKNICRDLGKFGPSETILDFLLNKHSEDYFFRKEILVILNEVISGSEKMEVHVVNHLLDFYLDSQNLYLPLQVNETDCINLRDAQTNIIQVALIMEGIGKLAKRIGIHFQDYFLRSLYYVLERMGSSYSIIREAAMKTAIQIADACKIEGGVKSLIQTNFDYLTYHLTVKLKRNDNSVFDVITVLMRNTLFETLPNLEEIIKSVLKSSSQNFDSPHTLSYLKLFQTFIVCVRQWMKTDVQQSPLNTQSVESDMNRLIKYLKAVTKKGTELEEEEEEKEMEEVPQKTFDDKSILEEHEKPKLPRHIELTLAVANHCLHYLASKDKNKKIIVLEILNECVWILADREDDLLPLVHNIWSPLVTRFELITDPLIINRSFKLLCTLSSTSKDFIRKRTLTNVLPTLESFLIKKASESKLKDSATGYFFTQNFKLQRELLKNLGKLASSLGLFERQTDLIVESALPYLSSLQPQELQEKCKALFGDLIDHDRHLIWYKLHDLVKNSEFAQNAKAILSLLEKRRVKTPEQPFIELSFAFLKGLDLRSEISDGTSGRYLEYLDARYFRSVLFIHVLKTCPHMQRACAPLGTRPPSGCLLSSAAYTQSRKYLIAPSNNFWEQTDVPCIGIIHSPDGGTQSHKARYRIKELSKKSIFIPNISVSPN